MILHEMALAMGFPEVSVMLSLMTSKQYSEWMAYYYVKNGEFKKDQEKQNMGKKLRNSLGHLVVKKGQK